MKTTLIQLIGGQNLPNLYSIIAFKPEVLVNVYSKRTKKQEASLNEAIQDISPNLDIQSIILKDFPTSSETQVALNSYMEGIEKEKHTVIFNLTGGTKLMSIGAYLAAQENESPSVYLDTQSHKFHDGNTSNYSVIEEFLGGNESTKELAATIPLSSILRANQFSIIGSQEFHNQSLLNLALALDAEKQSSKSKRVIELYRSEEALQNITNLLRTEFDFGGEINRLCVEAQLMQWGDISCQEGVYIRSYEQSPHSEHKEKIKAINNFLTGSWWELLLATELEKQTALTDIHWSVDVQQREGTSSEEDILARANTELLCFSCKMSSFQAKLFTEIHKLSSNTKNMGGIFAKPVLAVYTFHNKANENELREIAKELKIKIITREDLYILDKHFGKKTIVNNI